jgi:hypothetical protein
LIHCRSPTPPAINFVYRADLQPWRSSSSQQLPLKVVLLTCSPSECEYRWSIEDSIHSKRRNRLGQEIVDRLVDTHVNLNLEQGLELYESGMIPWDIEMTAEDPLSDDVDGLPHSVSDSESESENDS